MKPFIPTINIEPDKFYLVLMSNSEGYGRIGEVYYMTKLGSYISSDVEKDFSVYAYPSRTFSTLRQWCLSIYDSYHMTVKNWNKIYEFNNMEEVKKFLDKLKLTKKLKG